MKTKNSLLNIKVLSLIFLLFAYTDATLIKKFLVDNFEQNSGRNQYGGYWYVFTERDEYFAKPDKITGKVWISTASVFTFVTSTGGIITVNNTNNAMVFTGCDWNGNGIYDTPTKLIPEPDPLEGTIFQAWTLGLPNNNFCARIEYDFSYAEMKFPFVGIGSNLINFEEIKNVETDMKSYRDLSEYNAIAFWLKVSSTVGDVIVGVSYKNGPGAHGETPHTKHINLLPSEREKWVWKVVFFNEMSVPEWVPTSKYSEFFNEFNFTFPSKLQKWDKIKSLNFEIEGARDWTSPKQYNLIGSNNIRGYLMVDDVYFVYIDTSSLLNINVDTDSDGYKDVEEYAFGSDVNNSKSYPSIDINLNKIPDEEEGVSFLEVKCENSVVEIEDGVNINYSLTKQETGKIKIKIIDSRGLIVMEDTTDIAGIKGQYFWDCKTSSGKYIIPGIYIVYLELFNGKSQKAYFVVKSYK
ncbi:MAG: hypothetical protein N2643_01990 [Endomicrobia bacterium]|nr:hypothetical protein [Endomicrobiia bacterium]